MAKARLCDVCNRYTPRKEITKFPVRRNTIFPKNIDVCPGCIRAILGNIMPGEGEITEREWAQAVDLTIVARWKRDNGRVSDGEEKTAD